MINKDARDNFLSQISPDLSIDKIRQIVTAAAHTEELPQFVTAKIQLYEIIIEELSFDVQRYKSALDRDCLLYTSPSPRDKRQSRMPSSA